MSKLIATEHGLSRRMALKALAIMGTSAQALAEQGTLTLQRRDGKPTDTPTDPDLHAGIVPWPRTLNQQSLETLATLCDLILPADDGSPSASALGCHDFIDEWVSAPYPNQVADNTLILQGLEWLDAETKRRFNESRFTRLVLSQQHEICDDICVAETSSARLQVGIDFFTKVRNLTAAAYWTTQPGMDDLGYIGNVPLATWTLPPKEVLDHLKLNASDIP
jgi:gluconate 2-dehydrogenase gamma chain